MRFAISLAVFVCCAALLGESAWAQAPSGTKVRKPSMADTIKANMYGDNTFVMYINGELVAVDSITFIPDNWYAVHFDDSSWGNAKEYTEEEVGPKQPYFENDSKGAKFIWTDDVALDNTVIFRHKVLASPDGKQRDDFTGLTNKVPEGPPGGGKKGKK